MNRLGTLPETRFREFYRLCMRGVWWLPDSSSDLYGRTIDDRAQEAVSLDIGPSMKLGGPVRSKVM